MNNGILDEEHSHMLANAIDHRETIRHQEDLNLINAQIEMVLVKTFGLTPYKDGDSWCVCLGENIQVGIYGFGDTPLKAVLAFNQAFNNKKIEFNETDNRTDAYCMPDGINSKEDHEQYLKDIGHEKYVKDLECHKETTVGLYAFDQDLNKIFENLPNKEGCKTSVEAYMVQQIDYLKSIVFQIK
jgi:hypothetical protein